MGGKRFQDILESSIYDWNNPEVDEEDQKTLVILSMKNPSRIRKIIKLFDDACKIVKILISFQLL